MSRDFIGFGMPNPDLIRSCLGFDLKGLMHFWQDKGLNCISNCLNDDLLCGESLQVKGLQILPSTTPF